MCCERGRPCVSKAGPTVSSPAEQTYHLLSWNVEVGNGCCEEQHGPRPQSTQNVGRQLLQSVQVVCQARESDFVEETMATLHNLLSLPHQSHQSLLLLCWHCMSETSVRLLRNSPLRIALTQYLDLIIIRNVQTVQQSRGREVPCERLQCFGSIEKYDGVSILQKMPVFTIKHIKTATS